MSAYRISYVFRHVVMSFFRSQFVLVFLALMLLRIIIGAHFFHEGTTKLKSRSFDCEPVFSQAKGPLAPLFHGIIDDFSGHTRLCIAQVENSSEEKFEIDTTLTFAVWEDFIETAKQHTEDADRQSQLDRTLRLSKDQLRDFFAINQEKIIAWASSENRLEGFDRDGDRREKVAQGVESLNEQVASIRQTRTSESRAWLGEVEGIWDNLEDAARAIVEAEPEQMQLDRPFRQENSRHQLINKYIPWFDAVVGGLLIIGLFSRVASFAGLLLLLGIVATQPPWVLGTVNTFPQWIEIAGLAVIFATAAGRCGGLDYFLVRRKNEEEQDLES